MAFSNKRFRALYLYLVLVRKEEEMMEGERKERGEGGRENKLTRRLERVEYGGFRKCTNFIRP